MTHLPGDITPLPDGRYEVHSLTTSTIVADRVLAETVARRVRKAFGVAEPKERPSKNAARQVRMGRRKTDADAPKDA